MKDGAGEAYAAMTGLVFMASFHTYLQTEDYYINFFAKVGTHYIFKTLTHRTHRTPNLFLQQPHAGLPPLSGFLFSSVSPTFTTKQCLCVEDLH
jgi:hypothetical protein